MKGGVLMNWINTPYNRQNAKGCGDLCNIDLLPPGSCGIKICYKKYS